MNNAVFSPWPSLFWLAVILLIIVGVGALIKNKKLPTLQSKQKALLIKTISHTPLGQNERLVVVEIGSHWHVLGVTAHSITSITQLPKPEEVLPVEPEASFASDAIEQSKGAANDAHV